MGDHDKENHYTRREMLKMTVATGSGLMIGASGLGFVSHLIDPKVKPKTAKANRNETVAFYGKHQAGIATPQQAYLYLISFDLETESKHKIIQLFKQWTKLSELFAVGNWQPNAANQQLPPADTGEALGISPGYLTMTYGLGPTFFKKNGRDRFGLAHKMPKFLKEIPRVGNQNLDTSISNGDLCIQVCSEIKQVAFHAVRNLINTGIGTVSVRWIQEGFISGAKGETKRNLFGFKDGTANVKEKLDDTVWAGADEPSWMRGGTYMAYRKIQMFLEDWDQDSLKDQEDTFGRMKESGAPYGKIHEQDAVDPKKMPSDSHVRVAHTYGAPIYRRSYNYASGINKLGKLDAGLAFICFQKNPENSFLPKLKALGKLDALNEYTQHIGSAMFAIPRGMKKGEYIAQALFES
ncbi:deferrochelatase [Pullulanibacillus camelliae]|uniref:Deferrochelatase n=1 Tax=Pullulanibacillus camelliae TaxID=1707096 RepID=A0A8J2VKR6_9BACL|nr:iron uptake transporter deferrochelatase/peroxidase subunit [Pullulanibacillus camelliae]GGE35000.1 deferrochelatase [Pullulanibacillus camelliae]